MSSSILPNHLPGTLYIVATPIGNLEDITLRALRILKAVDLIAAEDTRHSCKLLAHYQIAGPIISCHEHNEARRIPQLIEKMHSGSDIALISDAGTPAISDPGYRLVKAAVAAGLTVVPIPGASAVTSGLSVCGLPTDAFHFMGFLSKKRGQRHQQIESLREMKATLIFYESPKRLVALLRELAEGLGDRPAMVAREITKLHEEFIRGSLTEIIEKLEGRDAVKGECALFVGWQEKEPTEGLTEDQIDQHIREALDENTQSPSKLAKSLGVALSLPKQEIYDRILKLRNRS